MILFFLTKYLVELNNISIFAAALRDVSHRNNKTIWQNDQEPIISGAMKVTLKGFVPAEVEVDQTKTKRYQKGTKK